MGLKVSNAMNSALEKLREFGADAIAAGGARVDIKVNDEQLGQLVDGYQTTLKDGTERGVTLGDLEATDNFRRDMHTAARVVNAEIGYPFLEENADQDSQKVSIQLPEIAGHGMTITSAVYRPGKEEEGEQNYSSITRSWNPSEDDKAVDDYLSKLGAKLKGGKAKK